VHRTHVNLEPKYLDKDLKRHIDRHVQSRLCHRCIPQLGYVKHVQILKHSLGEDAASRSLGLVSYTVLTRCQVCVPERGMQLDARVVVSDTPGIISVNDELPLFKLNVPQLWFSRSPLCTPELSSLAQLSEGTHVRVQVEASELRVSNGIAQYSVLCTLVKVYEGFRTHVTVAQMPRNVRVAVDEKDDGAERMPSLKEAFRELDEVKHRVVGTLSEQPLEDTGPGPLSKLSRSMFTSTWDAIRMLINPREEVSARFLDLCRCVDTRDVPRQPRGSASSGLSRAAAKIPELLGRLPVKNRHGDEDEDEDDGDGDGVVPAVDAPWIACIAESPGGFLTSLMDTYGDDFAYVAMSISPTDHDSGPWTKLRKFWKRNRPHAAVATFTNIDAETMGEISGTPVEERRGTCCLIGDYGDVYGDVTSIVARERLVQLCCDSGGAWLVTADGGVTRDKNLSGTEERDLYALAVSETICAFSILARGGTFILKVFDVTTVKMFRLIQLLSLCFVRVELTKPHTSRVANSERYVVATGFERARDVELLKLLEDHYQKLETTTLAFVSTASGGADGAATSRMVEQTVASIEEHSRQLLSRQVTFLRSGGQLAQKYADADTVIERESILREMVRLNPNFQQR
jgi:23S rRNA U2552 (ribose-2'-O)-methylase RlmE/FtsJ